MNWETYPSLSSGLRQVPRQDTKHGKENVPWVLVCHGPQASVSVQDTGERTASGVLDSTSTAWVTSQC